MLATMYNFLLIRRLRSGHFLSPIVMGTAFFLCGNSHPSQPSPSEEGATRLNHRRLFKYAAMVRARLSLLLGMTNLAKDRVRHRGVLAPVGVFLCGVPGQHHALIMAGAGSRSSP